MDEKLQKQLIQQMKILNIWISVFGTLILLSIAVIGYMLFQVIMFAQNTARQVQDFRQETTDSLNVEKQICEGSGQLGSLLRSQTDACKEGE